MNTTTIFRKPVYYQLTGARSKEKEEIFIRTEEGWGLLVSYQINLNK